MCANPSNHLNHVYSLQCIHLKLEVAPNTIKDHFEQSEDNVLRLCDLNKMLPGTRELPWP